MIEVLEGDALTELRELPDESVQCCVTSPPYWGLRNYSTNGQLGLEKTPEEYVAKMVEIFREVRRVLRRDGTLWLNLGDSYASSGGERDYGSSDGATGRGNGTRRHDVPASGLKPKDLCGIPWRVAFALQADGWWLRSDIIWSKPNPMPESVTDRPTKAHEYLFLLTKASSYYYDAEAIKEKAEESSGGWQSRARNGDSTLGVNSLRCDDRNDGGECIGAGRALSNRNKRSVWTVATAPYPEAHFATYPPDLIKPCIMAGTSAKGCCASCGAPWERVVELGDVTARGGKCDRYFEARLDSRSGDPNGMTAREHKTLGWQPTCKCDAGIEPCVCLDPFAGSGTTGAVALELGRKAVLIELNPKYVELIETRCDVTMGLALA